MKSILLLVCLAATAAYGQIMVPQVITITAAKDFSNGSLNVNLQGVDFNIPASVLQVASNVLNLLNVSVQRALAGDTTIDVPVTVNADSVVFRIWGNDWVLKKSANDLKNFAAAIELYRNALLTMQDAWYYFVV